MQELADVVVVESLPLATCPAHAVFPARRTLSSVLHALQVVPHPLKDLQGLSVSMSESTLYKAFISAGNTAVKFLWFNDRHNVYIRL